MLPEDIASIKTDYLKPGEDELSVVVSIGNTVALSVPQEIRMQRRSNENWKMKLQYLAKEVSVFYTDHITLVYVNKTLTTLVPELKANVVYTNTRLCSHTESFSF